MKKYSTEEERKEANREYQRRWRKNNKEKMEEAWRLWKEKNTEKVKQCDREKCKRWRDKNKEKIAEYAKQYKLEHQEKIAERAKQWRKEHKEEIAEYNKKYRKTPYGRANKLFQKYKKLDKKYNRGECTLTPQWIVDNIFTQPCHYCGASGCEKIGCDRIDNSKPHTEDNVVPCCYECNVKRGKKSYIEYKKETSQVNS